MPPDTGFTFDPDVDSILPVDDCWLVDPRLLAKRVDPDGVEPFEQAFATAVDSLARLGYGCAPDPGAGDGAPQSLVATCIVYRAPEPSLVRVPDAERELHLRLLCGMARTDGAFVGSELAVALEVADRLAGRNASYRSRFRALVRELFMNSALERDPLAQLATMPRPQALHIAETLTSIAWADGFLRSAEHRMLSRVHDMLGLPPIPHESAPGIVQHVTQDAA